VTAVLARVGPQKQAAGALAHSSLLSVFVVVVVAQTDHAAFEGG